jgi:rhodanese-related sulfurtransferase
MCGYSDNWEPQQGLHRAYRPAERLGTTNPPLALDVRAPAERAGGHLGGSAGIPLNRLIARLSELPEHRPLLVYCAGGYGSSIAASLLQHHGFDQVSEIAGGITAWNAAALPVSRPEPDPGPPAAAGTQAGGTDAGPSPRGRRAGPSLCRAAAGVHRRFVPRSCAGSEGVARAARTSAASYVVSSRRCP